MMGVFDKVKQKAGSVKDKHEELKEVASVKSDLVLSPFSADGFVGVFPMDGHPYELTYLIESEHEETFTDDLLDGDTGSVEQVDIVTITDDYSEVRAYLTADGRHAMRRRDEDAFTQFKHKKFDQLILVLEDEVCSFATEMVRKDGVVAVYGGDTEIALHEGELGVSVLPDYGEMDDVHAFEDHPMVNDYYVYKHEDQSVINYELVVEPAYRMVLIDTEEEYYREDPDLIDEYVRRLS